jgi:hypothetical protein
MVGRVNETARNSAGLSGSCGRGRDINARHDTQIKTVDMPVAKLRTTRVTCILSIMHKNEVYRKRICQCDYWPMRRRF